MCDTETWTSLDTFPRSSKRIVVPTTVKVSQGNCHIRGGTPRIERTKPQRAFSPFDSALGLSAKRKNNTPADICMRRRGTDGQRLLKQRQCHGAVPPLHTDGKSSKRQDNAIILTVGHCSLGIPERGKWVGLLPPAAQENGMVAFSRIGVRKCISRFERQRSFQQSQRSL